MVELLDAERVELNVAVGMLGFLIIALGLTRHFLNTKFPASTVIPLLSSLHLKKRKHRKRKIEGTEKKEENVAVGMLSLPWPQASFPNTKFPASSPHKKKAEKGKGKGKEKKKEEAERKKKMWQWMLGS